MAGDRTHREWGSRWDPWLGSALGAGFLLLYLSTLCPTVYLGDVGDFCTAIATGGVAHPPGYPLFSLLGRVALRLVPAGEPAFRIGCVVVVAAALTVVALYFLARELRCSPWAAGVAAATFGAGYTFWSQSTRVEVYSLHLLLVCLLLLAALRYRRTGRLGDLAAATLAGSLGLAHHLTIALLAPALLLLCGRRLWRRAGRGRRLMMIAAVLPVGPMLYLLLLVWARTEPLHSWGRTVDFPLLWNHASARIYHGLLRWPEPDKLAARLVESGRFFADNFPWFLCLLPLVGAGRLWRQDRTINASLLLVMGVIGAYNLCYRIDDIAPYYLPLWLVGAALLAVALEGFRGVRLHHPRLVGAMLALLPALLVLRNWSACDLSGCTWVRDFARHQLENAPPRGVLITQGDHDRFPIWYVRDVLNVRPDVLPVDRIFLNDGCSDRFRDPSQWYLHRLRRQGVDAPLPHDASPAGRGRLAGDDSLIRLVEGPLKDRPLCITFADTADSLELDQRVFFHWAEQRYTLVPHGLILQYRPRGRPVDLKTLVRQNDQLWGTMALPDLRNVRMDRDLDPAYVQQHYARMLVSYGRLREMAGDLAGAAAVYRRVADWAPEYQPARAALSSLRRHRAAQARRRTEAAVAGAG